jgi:hemolysin III
MDWLAPHEPVSAWTHGLWAAAAVPAGACLLWQNRRDPAKLVGTLIFSTSFTFCFGASCLFHAAAPGPARQLFRELDHIGIYLLIVGTVTPIALCILRGWWRRWLLAQIWVLALAGCVLRLTVAVPQWAETLFYLALGWIGVLTYFELARRVTHKALRPMWLGGACYSIGAVINDGRWPEPWPGVFGHHELFHLWVMAGSACHYWFMLRVLTAYRPLTPSPLPQLGERGRGEAAAPARPAADTSPAAGAPLGPVHTFQES